LNVEKQRLYIPSINLLAPGRNRVEGLSHIG
jgi:hypothetical protein